MLFNSIRFVVFFAVVTALHFLTPRRWRWLPLLAASCLFYALFVPAYLLILLATITIDYVAGAWIESTSNRTVKRWCLYLSIASVCGILATFKYLHFFEQNVAAVAALFHWNYSPSALRLVLPIGLSFHTFQSLSYVIEVYRGKQRAERHFGIYALYVMYFPQLVAGPIERPQNLLPQFHARKDFDWTRARDGLGLALWGLFKKVVVADSLAIYVDAVYGAPSRHNGTSLLVATYFFALQIYCDFSGYSDIARGVSRVYGIELMKNFEAPYFSRSITEFWTRWHMSLSTWFRDYVYVPLGGNRVPFARNLFNLAAVFVLSGLWHGANWTFVVWGALNGLYLIVERTFDVLRGKDSRAKEARPKGGLTGLLRIALTFHLVLVTWVYFRADRVDTAVDILRKIVSQRGPLFWNPLLVQGVLGIAAVLAVEVLMRRPSLRNAWRFSSFRLSYAVLLLFAIVLFGIDRGAQFIYFQF